MLQNGISKFCNILLVFFCFSLIFLRGVIKGYILLRCDFRIDNIAADFLGFPDLAVYEMDDIPAVHHPDIIVKQGEIPHIWKAVVH